MVAGPLGVIAIYFRLRTTESPKFTQETLKEVASVGRPVGPLGLIRDYWRPMLQVFGLVTAANTIGYAFTSYMPTFMNTANNHDAVTGNLVTVPLLLAMVVAMPFVGMLSDRVGRKRVLWAASLWVLLLSIPAFTLLQSDQIMLNLMGLGLIGAPVALYMGTLASTYPALFPTSNRYAGIGMSYNISVAIFGGTSPLIIESLIRWTGTQLAAPLYLSLMALVGVVVIITLKESAGRPLPGSAPAHEEP